MSSLRVACARGCPCIVLLDILRKRDREREMFLSPDEGMGHKEGKGRVRVYLIDRNGECGAIAGLEHQSRRAPCLVLRLSCFSEDICITCSVQREDRLRGDITCRHVEHLEHDLRHFLAICLRVQCHLREKHRMLLGSNSELAVERMMPDL